LTSELFGRNIASNNRRTGKMTALKVIANIFLSLLLFLCLILTGVAITVNATALSSGFITGQINKLDIVTLFNEEVLPELQDDETLEDYPGFITGLQTAVENNVPALKSAVNSAVKDVYGHVAGSEDLDLRRTLKNSLLDPDLTANILNDIDISPFIPDLLKEDTLFESMEIAGHYIDLSSYMDEVATVIEPSLKQQFIDQIPALYSYLLGENSTLEISIATGPLVADIGAALKSAFLASPPTPLSSMPQNELSLAFDTAWAQTQTQIPANINVDSEEIGLEQPDEITQALDDAKTTLAEVKEWVGYYRLAFCGLVLLTILWIGLIILVNRDVRINCRVIGGVFATYGIGEAVGLLVSRGFIHSLALSEFDAPASLQPWIAQLIDSITNPLLVFSIGCAVIGVILIVLSFFYHRTPAIPLQSEAM
jgi:hypothetical protein